MNMPAANSNVARAEKVDTIICSVRRAAWFAYAMTVALMVFDYVDRQVIVSMFRYLKAEWNLSDKELGAARLGDLDHRRGVRHSGGVDRRPRQPLSKASS